MTKILTGPAAAQTPTAAAQGRSIGLARVSTRHQSLEAQVAQLEAAGCERVFAERISTRVAEADRPQLQACLDALQPEDELVVVRLDRLGRTQSEVIARLANFQQQGIHVRTLDGLLNTRALGSMAPVVVGLLTGLAQMERELIAERTRASVEHRRATGGDLGGRPRSYSDEQFEQVKRLVAEGMSIAAIARSTGLAESTARRLAKATTT